MKHSAIIRRLFALLLCAVLVLNAVTITGTAGGQSLVTKSTSLDGVAEPAVSEEVVAWREENVKHFDMGDGTYQAVVYSHPVHEKDSQGVWQDIDFGLNLDQTQKAAAYTSKVSGVNFAASYTENSKLVSISSGDSAISLTLMVPQTATRGIEKRTVAAKVMEADSSVRTYEEARNAKFASKVLYENVLPGVDLEYVTDICVVKENIIVKEPMTSYSFTFQLDLEGLYPEVAKEGCIFIYDTQSDERKYGIAAPYMYDGMGNMCEDVYYTLKQKGESWYLTVTADAEWINQKGRSFPITIDPSVSLTEKNVDDTFIIETQPGNALGGNHSLWVRSDRITYIKANNFSIPVGYVLKSAKLIGYYYYYDYVTTGSLLMSAHRVEQAWSEGTLTWNWANEWNNKGLATDELDRQRAYGTLCPTVDSPEEIEFTITKAAQGWVDGYYSNYGIGLKYISGNKSVILKSSETGSTYSPRFVFTYGYDYYYTSFYDSTMDGWEDEISQVTDVSCRVYKELFNLNFVNRRIADEQMLIRRLEDAHANEPEYIIKLPEVCPNGANTRCGDTIDCGTEHHKDIFAIHNQLASLIKDDYEKIVHWTDHAPVTYCNHDNDNPLNEKCTPVDPNIDDETARIVAFTNRGTPIIQVLNILPYDATDDEFVACMGMTLLHETAHTFGMEEAYNDPTHETKGWNCVMEAYEANEEDSLREFYENISVNGWSAFCNRCIMELQSCIAES